MKRSSSLLLAAAVAIAGWTAMPAKAAAIAPAPSVAATETSEGIVQAHYRRHYGHRDRVVRRHYRPHSYYPYPYAYYRPYYRSYYHPYYAPYYHYRPGLSFQFGYGW
jgi:hypothetical protein